MPESISLKLLPLREEFDYLKSAEMLAEELKDAQNAEQVDFGLRRQLETYHKGLIEPYARLAQRVAFTMDLLPRVSDGNEGGPANQAFVKGTLAGAALARLVYIEALSFHSLLGDPTITREQNEGTVSEQVNALIETIGKSKKGLTAMGAQTESIVRGIGAIGLETDNAGLVSSYAHGCGFVIYHAAEQHKAIKEPPQIQDILIELGPRSHNPDYDWDTAAIKELFTNN